MAICSATVTEHNDYKQRWIHKKYEIWERHLNGFFLPWQMLICQKLAISKCFQYELPFYCQDICLPCGRASLVVWPASMLWYLAGAASMPKLDRQKCSFAWILGNKKWRGQRWHSCDLATSVVVLPAKNLPWLHWTC